MRASVLALAIGVLNGGAALGQPASSGPQAPGATVIGAGIGYVTLIRDGAGANKGRLLLSWEEPGRHGLPVYESRDDGKTWTLLSRVVDTAHASPDWQIDWQPNLYQLPRASGPLPAGTLLFAANSGFVGGGQDLQLYASQDGGKTWAYRGSIVQGHGHAPDVDNHGVWEPNMRVLDDGRLVAYYSSEAHKAEGFNQLLAHKVSTDGGRTWGPEVVDVAVPGGVERPGMAVVEPLPDGRYVMSYEDIDGPRNNGQVYLKFSRDGLDWGEPSDRGTPVETASGAHPIASPVVKWLPIGGPKGLLVIVAMRGGGGGDADGRDLYWNNDLGRGPWWRAPAPVRKAFGNIHAGWTQGLLLDDTGELLHITSSSSAEAPARADKNLIVEARAPFILHRYEAEDGKRFGGAAFVPDHSASADYKVRIPSAPLGKVRFEITADRAGPTELALRYAPLSRPVSLDVSVNGARFASGGAGQLDGRTWSVSRLPVTLQPGENVIEVGAAGGPVDLDWIELKP
jgi:hypothetical protein